MKKNQSYMYQVILVVVFAFCTNIALGQGANNLKRDSVEVQSVADSFLTAFRNLNWDKFISFFAEDATAFFPPSANYRSRANNKKEIENIFKSVFSNFKSHGLSHISIEPKDSRIQILNNTVAIVTFHLDDPGLFGRRTIVFQKIENEWLIIHLHASGIAN